MLQFNNLTVSLLNSYPEHGIINTDIKNPPLNPESSRHMYSLYFVVFLGTGYSNI